MNPLVSVIVPNYNHEQYLKQRIDSVLNQSFQNFELIILDDCSADASAEIIESYRDHPKVSQIVYNEKNSGSTFHQWNSAVMSLANGQFIWLAESDDAADPFFLQTLVPILSQHQDVVLAYTQSLRMNSSGDITGTWLDHTQHFDDAEVFQNAFQMQGVEYNEKFLFFKNTIPNASAVLFRRDAFINANGALPALRTNGDWDIWFKILLQGDIYYSQQCLNSFRYHDRSVIAQARHDQNGRLALKCKLHQYDIDLSESLKQAMVQMNQADTLLFEMNHQKLKRLQQKLFLLKIRLACIHWLKKIFFLPAK